MFQFAFEAVLFKFTYAPQFAPLLVLPPTSATARQKHRKAHTISLYFQFSLYSHFKGDCSPCPPVRLMPPKVLRKKESRRCPNPHAKQCRSNTHTRAAVRAVVGATTDKRDRTAEASEGAHNIPIFSIFFILTLQGGLLPLSPCAAYAAKGSSQEGEPPMLQFAYEAVEFKYTAAPQFAPW